MKTIYITALHLAYGGIENVIASLANLFCENGFSVKILCTYNLGDPAYFINKDVEIIYLTKFKPNKKEFNQALNSKNPFVILKHGLKALKILYFKKKTLQTAIKRIKSGIIISTRNEHNVILSRFGNKNVRKIAQIHNDHGFNKKLLNDFKKNYKNLDYLTVLTELHKKEFESFFKEKNKKTICVVLENFLNSENYTTPLIEKKQKQIITVGRLHPVKGYFRLLEIWANIIKEKPDFKLKIIGDGEELEKLRNKAQKLDIQNSVIFTGFLSSKEIEKEMLNSYIYLMSSYSEAFPLVLLEAFNAALPAVAFDVRTGPRAIIQNNKNGFLIKDGDIKEYTEKTLKLLNDKQLLEQFSQSAKKRVNEFAKEKMLEKWLKILN